MTASRATAPWGPGKIRTGRQLANPVLTTEGRVTTIDGLLAVAVLLGLVLSIGVGWWWADPLAGLIIACHAVREARHIHSGLRTTTA